MRILLIFFLLGFSTALLGQTEPEPKQRRLPYYNTFLAGGLIGKDGLGTTVSFLTTHGVRYNRLSFGLGIGFDDYSRNMVMGPYGNSFYTHWKSMPILGSLSFDIAEPFNQKLFIQVNGGYSKLWHDSNVEFDHVRNIKGGMMINPQAGIRIASSKHSLYFTAGYKWQMNRYSSDPIYWIWGYPSTSTNVKEVNERMVIQIGYGLN